MKRLIVCCDGTWNNLDRECPTNVVKIAQAIRPIANDGTPQVICYEEGLGTQWYSKLPGGAFGWGIDLDIQNAYHFLCLNYTPGDEIYLFGFSRGAYTVRSLAGLIYCSGLLSRSHICRAPKAYQMYRDRKIHPKSAEAEQFRADFGDRVPITLLGCWDTVGALGIPDLIPELSIDDWVNTKYQFHDCELSWIVQNALHAVAIDEQRKPFNVTPMEKSNNPKGQNQKLRQVWFPGSHGCVGGGTSENRGLSDGALLWMLQSTHELGLKLDFDRDAIDGGITLNPNLTFGSNSKLAKLGGSIQRTVTGTFDDLHESVLTRWRDRPDYRPKNLAAFEEKLKAFALSSLASKSGEALV